MFNSKNAAHYGRIGGKRTAEKYGRAHFSKAGRKGFQATTDRYFDGDERKHKQFLAEQCGWNYFVQSGRSLKRDRDGKPIWRKPTHPARKHEEIPF